MNAFLFRGQGTDVVVHIAVYDHIGRITGYIVDGVPSEIPVLHVLFDFLHGIMGEFVHGFAPNGGSIFFEVIGCSPTVVFLLIR